ncbi:MAG TPA: DUF2703 domain-containing protein [Firmicutes bacterium]|nr:DUF2703 domain-containing protein [Bacillota bacterium]
MNGSCCVEDAECCCPKPKHRRIEIDFLYLDLTVCTRCIGTDANLEAAIREVSDVLKMAGFDVVVNKINVTSKELAVKHKFLSSPTIRVDGRDIQPNIRESACESCVDLCACGESVDCRVWMHDGTEYTVPPKEFIVNAILREVYSDTPTSGQDTHEYRLPHNLEVFFRGR